MSENSLKSKWLQVTRASKKLFARHPVVRKICIALGYSVWIVASFFVGVIITVALLIIVIKLGLGYGTLSEAVRSTIEAALSFTFSVLIAVLVPRRIFGSKNFRAYLGLDRTLQWSDMAYGVLGFIPYILLAMIVLAIAKTIIPGFDVAQAQDVGFNSLRASYEYILAFITLVVIAPVAEEILFRGYFYGGLRKSMGFIASSLIVSAVFGALHGQWNVGVNVFALSLVFCGLREMTGSIWAGIVLHMVKNAIAFYGLFMMHL